MNKRRHWTTNYLIYDLFINDFVHKDSKTVTWLEKRFVELLKAVLT